MNTDMEYETLEPTGEFAASIQNFRSAVTHVAERATAQPASANWLAPARRRRHSAQLRTGLGIAAGWACAALLCFATLPLVHPHHAVITLPVAQAAAAATATTESDSALLEQVDTNISASVPSSLEPLAELDSWNTTSANIPGDSSTNGSALTKTEKMNVAH
jgi:hypothetical protein